MYYHLFFYLIWKVVKKHETFFWESGVWYYLSRSVELNEDFIIKLQNTFKSYDENI